MESVETARKEVWGILVIPEWPLKYGFIPSFALRKLEGQIVSVTGRETTENEVAQDYNARRSEMNGYDDARLVGSLAWQKAKMGEGGRGWDTKAIGVAYENFRDLASYAKQHGLTPDSQASGTGRQLNAAYAKYLEMERALTLLPDKERGCFYARHCLHMEVEEVAVRGKMSAARVKSYLSAATKILIDALFEREEDYSIFGKRCRAIRSVAK